MKVEELMTHEPKTCTLDTTVAEAATFCSPRVLTNRFGQKRSSKRCKRFVGITIRSHTSLPPEESQEGWIRHNGCPPSSSHL